MKTLRVGFLLFFTMLALQPQAFLFKDTSKLWSKILQTDADAAKAPLEPVSKEENFFTLFRETKEKLFKEIPKTFKTLFRKFEDRVEKRVDKIEKEKDDFDEKIFNFLEDKKRFRNVFKDLIPEEKKDIKYPVIKNPVIKNPIIQNPVVNNPYYAPVPVPVAYKPKPKIINAPPKYIPISVEAVEPESAEVYVKPKIINVPPKYVPKSVEVVEPYSEEAYANPNSYALPAEPYPCSDDNGYYFT